MIIFLFDSGDFDCDANIKRFLAFKSFGRCAVHDWNEVLVNLHANDFGFGLHEISNDSYRECMPKFDCFESIFE